MRLSDLPPHVQERARRIMLGESPTPEPAEAERDARVLEKDEQAAVVKLLRGMGFDVWNLSQARASKQTPGLPDLWVMHREHPIAFWWETKRQVGGALSVPQEYFRDATLRCGVAHGVGDRYAAREFLRALGLEPPPVS